MTVTAAPLPAIAGRSYLNGAWTPVAQRSYGTVVYQVEGRNSYFCKLTPVRGDDDARCHPLAEAERMAWLGSLGFPVPEVVEAGSDGESMWIVTTALTGVTAEVEQFPFEQRATVIDLVADLVRSLHDVPSANCPFDRTLKVTIPQARQAVYQGHLDLDDLEPAHQGWTAEMLLEALDQVSVPAEEDVVVCHGDPSLDNLLIDPETLSLVGILDLGRLGRADRWLDLSIVVRELGAGSPAAERLLHRYGVATDAAKLDFYLLMDEFL